MRFYPKLIIHYTTFILFYCLLFFGTTFSKFQVLGVLHLFDALLLLMVFVSLFFIRLKFTNRHILLLIAISILYFIASLFSDYYSLSILIRQFAVIGYLAIGYILFNHLITNDIYFSKSMLYLKKFIFVGLCAQLIYIIILYFQNKFSFDGYHSLSPIVVMLIICCYAYCLTSMKTVYRYILLLICILSSFTIGHSSAVLPLLIISFFHISLNSKTIPLRYFIPTIGVSCLVVIYLFLPSYTDVNAMWRITFWKVALEDIIINNYGILGNGFGVPYCSEQDVKLFAKMFGGVNDLDIIEERYIKAFHNSFITIFYHIGLLPGLLLFYPSLKFSKLKYINLDNDFKFLALCLIGLIIWSFFNVVLELPHSSLFFWLIYFLFLFKLNYKIK